MVRGSLGAVKLLGEEAVSHRYPMYVIKVTDLLELDKWVPHQDLVKAGKMIQVRSDLDVEVLFISHQWTSFQHPDPSGEQLAALKRVIRRLMEGKTSVRSNATLESVYHSKFIISGTEWKTKLPAMYMWIDYLSIPQPGAVAAPKGAAAHATTDHRLMFNNLFKAGEEVPLDQNGDGEVTLAELVSGLKAAVDSIPSYIERSSMTWILVPPVKHADLENTMCDFNSWRSRGWCRMEFAASKLASGDDLPLMIVESEEGTPEFFNPCDTFKLCAAHGNFSVDDDREKVNSTLSTMIANKGISFEKMGDMTLARLVHVFAPVFVPRDGGDCGDAQPARFPREPGETAIDALKRRLKWRDEATEAAWIADTGLNLLILACCYDDLDAVNELLRTPEKQALLDGIGKTCNALNQAKVKEGDGPHRKAPMNLCTIQYAHGLTPLQAAMTFGSPPLVAALLDAGYDARKKTDGMNCLGQVHCHFKGAIMAGKVGNVKLFLDRYPEFISGRSPAGGDTPLHFACFIGKGQKQTDMVRTLIDKGADPNAVSLFWGTPILAAAAKYDTDPLVIKQLVDAGADVNALRKPAGVLKAFRRIAAGLGTVFGSVGLKGLARAVSEMLSFKGRTVLHYASERGDVNMIKTLTEVAPTLQTDVKGGAGRKGARLPLQMAEDKFGPHVVMKETIAKVLEDHVKKGPPVAPKQPGLQLV